MGNLAGIIFVGGLAAVGGFVMSNQSPSVAGDPPKREASAAVPLQTVSTPRSEPTRQPDVTVPDLADPENRITTDPGEEWNPDDPASIPNTKATSTKAAKTAKTKAAKQPKATSTATKAPTSTAAGTTTTAATAATPNMPATMPSTPTAPKFIAHTKSVQ